METELIKINMKTHSGSQCVMLHQHRLGACQKQILIQGPLIQQLWEWAQQPVFYQVPQAIWIHAKV